VRLAPGLYAATLFVSALLVFAIQPMFTKLILPRVGGAPAVWSVAMVFFQAALLIGYAHAHVLARVLRPLHAAFVHLAVLAVASLMLPIGIAYGFAAPPASGVVLWLFGLICRSSHSRRPHPSCRAGSHESIILMQVTPTSSMPPRTSARSPRCSLILSWQSRC
jgi:hypothetical protein